MRVPIELGTHTLSLIYLDSRKSEREFWYSLELEPPPTEYPTDKDVIAILLLASQFTSQTSPKVKPTFAEILALNL